MFVEDFGGCWTPGVGVGSDVHIRTAVHRRRRGRGTPPGPPPPPLPMFEADSQNFASAPLAPRGFTLQYYWPTFCGDYRGTMGGGGSPPNPPPLSNTSPGGGNLKIIGHTAIVWKICCDPPPPFPPTDGGGVALGRVRTPLHLLPRGVLLQALCTTCKASWSSAWPSSRTCASCGMKPGMPPPPPQLNGRVRAVGSDQSDARRNAKPGTCTCTCLPLPPSGLLLISQHRWGGGGRPMPHPAQPRHTNDWAPRTRKRHQREHRPHRPTERSDPTQHAKGRTGACPGPRKGATTRRNVARGGGVPHPPPP